MAWMTRPQNRPIVAETASAVGYTIGDLVTIQQGTSGVPIGLLLALTTTALYFPGIVTKAGFEESNV